MNINSLIDDIGKWMVIQLKERKKDGYVLGISGGIDSWVLLKLLLNLNIQIKCYHILYTDDDKKNAQIYSFDFDFFEIDVLDLRELYNLSREFTNPVLEKGEFLYHAINTNIKARLREMYFYNQAKLKNMLVIGTVNKAEYQLGYFVKNSSIGDILPFANIDKSTIREMAKELGATEKLINQKASGCINCKYAEEEWGISEASVDSILLGKIEGIEKLELEKYFKLNLNTYHKREFVPKYPHY